MAKRVRGFGFDQALRLMRQGQAVGRLGSERVYGIAESYAAGANFGRRGPDRIVSLFLFDDPAAWGHWAEISTADLVATDWAREADCRRAWAKATGEQNVAKQHAAFVPLDEPKPAVPALLTSEAKAFAKKPGKIVLRDQSGNGVHLRAPARTRRKAK